MEEIFKHLNNIEVRKGLHRTIKSYVIRNNTLDDEQREIVIKAADKYMAIFDEKMINPKTLFDDKEKPVVVEIGFGMGTSTKKIAEERSEFNYLALEVYLQGFVKLLGDVYKMQLDNIKLMRFNAVDVLSLMIEDESVEGFHIFFPDPWPKKKHHKRRIIQSDFVNLLAKKLRVGGYIYLATDWLEYAEWMLEILGKEKLLKNKYSNFADPVLWRPRTKFEQKGLDKNYKISEIWFERV